MAEFRMPALGADMTEGTLLEWLVKPGDTVHRGDVVAVIDTDKAAIDVEVFDDGVVQRLVVEPGTKVPVGSVLAEIGSATASPAPVTVTVTEPAVESPPVRHLAHVRGVDLTRVAGSGPDGSITRHDVEAATQPAATQPAAAQPAATQPATAPAPQVVRASPRAKRLATQRGVNLAHLTGTGPDGAVTVRDVEGMTPASVPAPTPAGHVPAAASRADSPRDAERLTAMRAATAALMARSKREIPHYYVASTLDVSPAMEWLGRTNAGRPVGERLIPAALMLKATALAARKVPEVNGFWIDETFQASEHVHLGVAVSLRGGGLVAPAILDADQLSVEDLMAQLRDLVSRTRSGRLRQREMSSGTLTVTNLGDNGADAVYGVIYPPQVALVGLGRVVERPWAHDGMVGARPTVSATLSADHRATNGHIGSRFLITLADLLNTPEEL